MHIRSELEVDPAALAHEMLSLLRRVRVPVVWWALRQRQIADSLLTCSGLVCVLVGYIFASSAPGNLRLHQVNSAGPTLRQVLVHCPRQATSAASAATINAASTGC